MNQRERNKRSVPWDNTQKPVLLLPFYYVFQAQIDTAVSIYHNGRLHFLAFV